jgi:hypothetical protein
MKKQILYGIFSFLLGAMAFLGTHAYTEAILYEKSTQELIDQMDAKKLAEFQFKEFAEALSLGLYQNDKKKKLEKILASQEKHKILSQKYALYTLSVLLVILGSYFVVSLRAFSFFGSLAALITLALGLVTPIMMVTIHKEVEYLGDVVLSFESKGVLGSIEKLLDGGDVIVAIVISLFSVIIPGVKTFSLLFVSVFIGNPFAHDVIKFFKMIGKWSMADVFVVATFLVYLTGNGSDVSRAEAEVGLYFFLGYVIVSMLVSLSADRMLYRLKK